MPFCAGCGRMFHFSEKGSVDTTVTLSEQAGAVVFHQQEEVSFCKKCASRRKVTFRVYVTVGTIVLTLMIAATVYNAIR